MSEPVSKSRWLPPIPSSISSSVHLQIPLTDTLALSSATLRATSVYGSVTSIIAPKCPQQQPAQEYQATLQQSPLHANTQGGEP